MAEKPETRYKLTEDKGDKLAKLTQEIIKKVKGPIKMPGREMFQTAKERMTGLKEIKGRICENCLRPLKHKKPLKDDPSKREGSVGPTKIDMKTDEVKRRRASF